MHNFPRRAGLRGLASCLLACIQAACALSPAEPRIEPAQPLPTETIAWDYADLRLLDPADATAPEHDLLAVYLRHAPPASPGNPPRTYLRLDFLDLPYQSRAQVYLALDFAPGGARWLPFPGNADLEWDALLEIPSGGPSRAFDPYNQPISKLAMRILRDPRLDFLEISFDPSALYPAHPAAFPPEIGVQVFIVPGDGSTIADQSLPTTSYAAPPQPARYLLAFWNTYPAETPAQALRRWDGAHTGPLGGRHGLANLLRTASAHRQPVFLLDLKNPAWLSALDYAGGLELVNALAEQGRLTLPEVFPPGGSPQARAYSRSLARRFDLPVTQYGYTQTLDQSSQDYALYFFPASLASPLTLSYRQGDHRLLPIPFDDPNQIQLQPTLDGLSLAARRWLIQAALSANADDPAPILILGGDLPQSTWGNPQISRAAFDELAGRPWMQPVDSYGLLNASPVTTASLPPVFETMALPPVDSLVALPSPVLAEIPADQSAPLLEAAAQSYLELVPPSLPAGPVDADLLATYLPYLNALKEAADWAQNPQPRSSCDLDLNQDGQLECQLASAHLFAILDPANGSLVYAFASNGSAVHQIIAGKLAPPGEQPAYQAEASPAQVVFNHPQGGIVKTYRLEGDMLRIEYKSNASTRLTLPLVLDPWLRYYPGWGRAYQGENIPGGYSWKAASGGAQVEIRTSASLQVAAFNDTQEYMNRVENPNQEFPPGHYLRFPIAVVEISSNRDFFVEIRIY